MTTTSSSDTKLSHALSLIDAAHSRDPTIHTLPNGTTIPYELHYAQRCTYWLNQRAPTNTSDTLTLAIRAQHLLRWEVPRASYPMTKPGYHAWRTFLKKRQGALAAEMCTEAGYSTEDAERVAALIRKEDLKKDEETMVLEDVACLVFLEDQFEEFSQREDVEDKIVNIVRKTWGKMSERGRELALGMELDERCKELVGKALAG